MICELGKPRPDSITAVWSEFCCAVLFCKIQKLRQQKKSRTTVHVDVQANMHLCCSHRVYNVPFFMATAPDEEMIVGYLVSILESPGQVYVIESHEIHFV